MADMPAVYADGTIVPNADGTLRQCCCEPTCPHCGTLLEDISCGPYEGFDMYAFPIGGGPPIVFWGSPAMWEDVCCVCDAMGEIEVTINGQCYTTDPLNLIYHYPNKPLPSSECQHLDITGKTEIMTFACGPCE